MQLQPMWSVVAVFIVAALTIACSEARKSSGTEGGEGGEGGSATTSPAGGGGASSGTTSEGGAGGAPGVPVVINEIGPTGDDYVEIKNIGKTSFSLAGFAIADLDDNGEPKLSEAARFPDGTEIASGERILLIAGQDPAAGVGPHDMCLSLGPTSCFYAEFGISGTNGDKIFLLTPDDEVAAEAEYPKDAATGENTWGRLPDGTGEFAETKKTPGDINEAP